MFFQEASLQNQCNSLQDTNSNKPGSKNHKPKCVLGEFLGSLILVSICAVGFYGWSFYLYYDRRYFWGTLVFMLTFGMRLDFAGAITFNGPLFWRVGWRSLTSQGPDGCETTKNTCNRQSFQHNSQIVTQKLQSLFAASRLPWGA
jgi:hypothetical protein